MIIVCPYNDLPFIYGSQFEEDPIIRHIEPPLATHLDLHRLSNFQIKFIPTITRSVHLFAAVPKTVLLRFSLVLLLVFLESISQRRTQVSPLSNCSIEIVHRLVYFQSASADVASKPKPNAAKKLTAETQVRFFVRVIINQVILNSS